MKRVGLSLKQQIVLIAFLSLLVVWSVAFYELYRTREASLHEAEMRTVTEAEVFAEYSRSTLKRINEFIVDVRTHWDDDWQKFATIVKRSQENIDDISFQVAIIDKDGLMVFSNLAKPTDRVDLSHREHFRVHKEANDEKPGIDRLFVSRPLMGKVSGKWSIQVTRPIFRDGRFNGVLVVSLSPEQFASFAKKLRIGKESVMTVVRSTGEIMARYPDWQSLGTVLKDRPFLKPEAPVFGNYRHTSQVDGEDRIWGFYRLPEYGMSFVMGESIDDVLAPFRANRVMVLSGAVGVSLLSSILFFLLYRSLSSLEEMKRQVDEIFILSPDGFVSFDAGRHVKYASPAFDRLTGISEAEIAGLDEKAFSDRLAQSCIETARFPGVAGLRAAQSVGASGTTRGEGGHRRQLIEMAGAGRRILEVGLREAQAETVSQILYFRDVTHETEVDQMKSEFLSTAAHELRTPMASIYGFSELMLTEDFSDAERREYIGVIHRQSELMASIINELLDIARIEARRGKDFKFSRIDASHLVDGIVAGLKLPDGRDPPEIRRPEGELWVRADHKKLTQAIGNVLSNAYKYSPEGGAVVIELFREEGRGRLGISIRDQGIGMTDEQVSRTCERFYRADTSGKIPGTGLGMSIVKEIIDLHGGELDIRSSFGKGTTVTLLLPVLTEEG